MKPDLSEIVLYDMLERSMRTKEQATLIKKISEKYELNFIDEDQLYWIASIIFDNHNKEIRENKSYELIKLILAIHSRSKIKIGKTECCEFNDELKEVLLEYIAEKYPIHLKRIWGKNSTTHLMATDTIKQKIMEGDSDFLNTYKTEIEKRIKDETKRLKKSNYTKYKARRICEIIHPIYTSYMEGLSKKEVCFIYDLLVLGSLLKEDNLISNDDKYDSIKRYFTKAKFKEEGCNGNIYEYIDYKD